ncbi:MAG: DUF3887 domain-containing protein [Oscillospiraceae bacterium]
MKKSLSLILALTICALTLTGCGGSKLPEGFDEKTALAAAENAVMTINAGEYESFTGLCAASVQETLSAEVLENAVTQVMPNAGAFEKFTSSALAGQKDEAGNECVVAVLVAKYANQSVTYTISLDKDLLIIGFYLK